MSNTLTTITAVDTHWFTLWKRFCPKVHTKKLYQIFQYKTAQMIKKKMMSKEHLKIVAKNPPKTSKIYLLKWLNLKGTV